MLWLFALFGLASAADLVVDGETVELSGVQQYDNVRVINNGRINVTPYNGTTGGTLSLIADTVLIDATSQIVATGAGYRGGGTNLPGEGPGGGLVSADGGGGGGHGGRGGNGLNDDADDCSYATNRGVANSNQTPSTDVVMGSGGAGGGGNGTGGRGGGAVYILARTLTMAGTITSNGNGGNAGANDAGGGGAGGAILLAADALTCSGTLRANGGNGPTPFNNTDGGGPGGGGMIEQYYYSSGTQCTTQAIPGTNRCPATGANPGVVTFLSLDEFDFDWDVDGYLLDDCDTTNPDISPAAVEVCDGVDNNCNNLTDDADGGVDVTTYTTFYRDTDGDTYGDLANTVRACAVPTGASVNALDCNDNNAAINPAATEVCDGVDNNCNNLIDDADPGVNSATFTTFYADADGDTFGSPTNTVRACAVPAGAVVNNLDCNDGDASLNPNTPWYLDGDNDTYGLLSNVVNQCATPAGRVRQPGDCNDANAAINPGATEVCDSVDNDCDLLIDDADPAVDSTTFNDYFADDDGDSYGATGVIVKACALPDGASLVGGDCDDDIAAINPEATEVCDGVDNDCDTLVDDADPTVSPASKLTWYLDGDDDGFGFTPAQACDAPPDHVADAGDCNDANATINPDATEVCDGIDNDCDGLVDDADPSVDATTFSTFYADSDEDEFGDPDVTEAACAPPVGFVIDATDCDDDDANTYPAAAELCDERDNDCDTEIDEDVVDVTWYFDNDFDGYGGFDDSQVNCASPGVGWVQVGGDCNDFDPQVSPGRFEVCDGQDTDCNGAVDDNPVDGADWFLDIDLDGFGDPTQAVFGCDNGVGYVTNGDDCDDDDASINPDAEEVCDGIDNDCDSAIDEDFDVFTWYRDRDGDTFGDPEDAVVTCDQPAGYVNNGDDCDDTRANVYPDATEIPGNGIDEACTGVDDPIIEVPPEETGTPRDVEGIDGVVSLAGGGCTCANQPGSAGWWPLLSLTLLLGARRRSRAA